MKNRRNLYRFEFGVVLIEFGFSLLEEAVIRLQSRRTTDRVESFEDLRFYFKSLTDTWADEFERFYFDRGNKK